jgi:HSP20 family protein
MLDRNDPFGRAMGLRQVMDRLLEDAFVMPRGGESQGWGGPSLNVYEEGDELMVEAQLPGLKPEDLEINVEQGVLTISGQIKAEEERKERNYLVREHRTGRFSRSLRLPPAYDADACKADFDHGVLRLVFPKSEAAKPRRIQISRASGDGQRVLTNGQSKAQPAGAGARS